MDNNYSAVSLMTELMMLQNTLQKEFDVSLSVHGISFNEYLIMSKISHSPEKCMRRIDLANQIGLSASGITRLINPMEKRGIMEKKSVSRDARVSMVKLSNAGEELFQDSSKTFKSIAERCTAKLKEHEVQIFLDLLKTLR